MAVHVKRFYNSNGNGIKDDGYVSNAQNKINTMRQVKIETGKALSTPPDEEKRIFN
jgi:hypothetical protein